MELKKELQERPTQKLVDDLKKKVQILQVLQQKYPCLLQLEQYLLFWRPPIHHGVKH
jgi:homeobox protein cut-like